MPGGCAGKDSARGEQHTQGSGNPRAVGRNHRRQDGRCSGMLPHLPAKSLEYNGGLPGCLPDLALLLNTTFNSCSIGACAHFPPMVSPTRRPSQRHRKGPPPGLRRQCWRLWPRRRRRSPTLRKTSSTSTWCLSATSVCGLRGCAAAVGIVGKLWSRAYNEFMEEGV